MMQFNKATGPKPSKTALEAAYKFARKSSGDAMAIAMSMRPNGATQNEIIAALGKPHRNKIRDLVESKQLKKQVLPEGTRSVRIKLLKK